MFTRSRKRTVALIALLAVMFAALMPGAASYASVLQATDVVALGGVCVTDYAASEQPSQSPLEQSARHGHCAFCTLGAPLVSAARFDTLLATLAEPAAPPPAHANDTLPRDAVAVHPLSPRAPPARDLTTPQ